MLRRLLPLLLLLPLTGCIVSKKKFTAAEAARVNCEKDLATNKQTVSELAADSARRGDQYRSLMRDKNMLEAQTRAEKDNLNQQLGQKGSELTDKNAALADRERKLKELQDVVARQDAAVNSLRSKVMDALVGFRGDDLSVQVRNGKVYVSLSEKLLFKSGSATVDPAGRDALKKLAGALQKNADIDILIEGHTDNVPLIPGKFDDNWDLSVSRATSIVRLLTGEGGLDPKRVVAAGHSEYEPIAANDTPEGKARNRRTDIILSPKLDELFGILNGGGR